MISSETSPVETRIVIIDDEPQIRKFLDIALRTQNIKPRSAKRLQRPRGFSNPRG
jgi:DNA-binding response OmpR family regulator